MVSRKAGIVAIAGAIVFGLAGCALLPHEPKFGGLSGLTENSKGDLVGLVQMCDGSVSGGYLWSGHGANETTLVSVDFPHDVSGYYAFSLGDMNAIVSRMSPHTTYILNVDGNDWAANDVEFKPSQLSNLAPGHVLADDIHHKGDVIMSTSDFRKSACSAEWGY